MVVPGVVRLPLVQLPPVDPVKSEQVPPGAMDQLPLAGPLLIVQLKVVVPLYATVVGEADKVQLGTGAGTMVMV